MTMVNEDVLKIVFNNITFEIEDESAQPGTSAENTERQSALSDDGTGRQDAPSVES